MNWALRREAETVMQEISEVEDDDEPPVVVLQVAEELREDELSVLVAAADRALRTVILCVLQGNSLRRAGGQR